MSMLFVHERKTCKPGAAATQRDGISAKLAVSQEESLPRENRSFMRVSKRKADRFPERRNNGPFAEQSHPRHRRLASEAVESRRAGSEVPDRWTRPPRASQAAARILASARLGVLGPM